ncbi:MAG TPA: hypothetical protein VER55_12450 [Ardenticatenaceae bacterium]|nr:hypothetical protein [Ardenticatenaceae bacterium]
MKKVGLLVGRERSFPDAVIAAINGRDAGVWAEYALLGGSYMAESVEYDVLIDRISHEVPYYQSYLKNAALQGVYVINNPFWRLADDKFFGTSLAAAIGVAVPKTILLPNKEYVPGVVAESLRNLEYPIDWEGILNFTGLPAIVKVHYGGGWKDVYRIDSLHDLLQVYDRSGLQTLMVQEFIQWERYVRCIVVGRQQVNATSWDPRRPHFERYRYDEPPLPAALQERIESDARRLCQALGYDMNTVEFAIRDGVPFAIDFMNSAPDFDISSLGQLYFDWTVNAMADYVIAVAHAPRAPQERWQQFINAPD